MCLQPHRQESLVTAIPKSCLPVTRTGRRGKQAFVEGGGAGLRFCGAVGGLVDILSVGPGCGKQGLKRSDTL